MKEEIIYNVVGMKYISDKPIYVGIGQRLYLLKETDNKFDKNAITANIKFNDQLHKIGYISKKQNTLIDMNQKYYVQWQSASVIKISNREISPVEIHEKELRRILGEITYEPYTDEEDRQNNWEFMKEL